MIFNDRFITRLLLRVGEKILKIDKHLAKLQARVGILFFWLMEYMQLDE